MDFATSGFGPFQTWRDVRLEFAMGSKQTLVKLKPWPRDGLGRSGRLTHLLPRIAALVICVVSIIGLGILVILIWAEAAWARRSLDQFRFYRKCAAGFAAVYALWCFGRLTANVAMPRELPPEFVPELIAISVFWVLAPPIWFFVEYFAVESDRITNLPGAAGPPAADAPANQAAADLAANEAAKAKYLKTIKDYADYASKIWAGVLALFLALIALKGK